jgi:hypothetical protein
VLSTKVERSAIGSLALEDTSSERSDRVEA